MADTQQSEQDIFKPEQEILSRRYRILNRLDKNQGYFAEVYLSEHIDLGSQHAIKVLRTHLSSEHDIQQFRNEARLVASLDHPNIIRVTDYGIENGHPCLVMSYASHGSLRSRHPRGTLLPLLTIIDYTKQLADALAYAHEKIHGEKKNERIVHRDIKPENILLGQNNRVLLSDFGLAVTVASSYTDFYQIAGTAYYMSPEQFRGKKPAPANDQYSLAVVVYEWLCGEPPFTEGDFLQLGFQHAFEPPPKLRDRNPAILPGLEEAVLKALAKEPEGRFPSIQAFADAIEQAIQLPGEEYYPPNVARAIRGCYYQYIGGADWGEMREITPEDAKPYVSRRGTKGYRYPFTRGGIYWSERCKAQPMWGAFANIHRAWEKEDGDYLGFPLTSELPASKSPQMTEGVFQRFEGPWDDYPEEVDTNPVRCGASLYDSKHGSYLTWGTIGLCYERLGGTSSMLGFPMTGGEDVETQEQQTKGICQSFEGGRIYWIEGATEAYQTWGAIGWRYNTLGRTAGRLGFPLSSEIDILSSEHSKLLGRYQRFQGGTVYWRKSPQDETYAVWGGIGRFYEQLGGAESPLGFPLSAEKTAKVGKRWYQHFEEGDIYLEQNSTAIVVKGTILEVYNQFDGIQGKFGFPKAPEISSPEHPELIMQEFEGGVISVKMK
jgi:Protein kinase domain/LGFP repeat